MSPSDRISCFLIVIPSRMFVRILVKYGLHFAQQVRQIEPHTLPDVPRKRLLEKRVIVMLSGVDITMRAVSSRLVGVDKGRLNGDADGVPRSIVADADIPQHEVIR